MRTVLACAFSFTLGVAIMMGTTGASPVFIGGEVPPGAYEYCLNLVNNVEDLGTDPSNASLGTGLDNLDTGTSSVLKFEQTNVPGDICTAGGQCASVGQITCAKDVPPLDLAGYDLKNFNNGAGVPVPFCFTECTDDLADPNLDPRYWVGYQCP
jgi:hypothetical protein